MFFVGDGVFQLLPDQRPGAVLARDYIATFKLLSLYDIDQCWLCADSARERGLDPATPWVVDVECLAPDALRARLHEFDVIFAFLRSPCSIRSVFLPGMPISQQCFA